MLSILFLRAAGAAAHCAAIKNFVKFLIRKQYYHVSNYLMISRGVKKSALRNFPQNTF